MHLNVNHGDPVTDPTPAQVREAILQLELDDVAILSRDEYTYIQTLVEEDGLVLEYQEGSLEEHYGVVGDLPSAQQVADAFAAYAEGDDAFKSGFEWEQMELDDADFLVVAICDSVEESTELDWEDSVELPDMPLAAMGGLYQLLCEGDLAERLKEFVVVAETSTDEIEEILLMPMPRDLHVALAALSQPQRAELAGRWVQSEGFPKDLLEESDALEALDELQTLAAEAEQAGRQLVVCDLR